MFWIQFDLCNNLHLVSLLPLWNAAKIFQTPSWNSFFKIITSVLDFTCFFATAVHHTWLNHCEIHHMVFSPCFILRWDISVIFPITVLKHVVTVFFLDNMTKLTWRFSVIEKKFGQWLKNNPVQSYLKLWRKLCQSSEIIPSM